jgi:hypothetical protein
MSAKLKDFTDQQLIHEMVTRGYSVGADFPKPPPTRTIKDTVGITYIVTFLITFAMMVAIIVIASRQ